MPIKIKNWHSARLQELGKFDPKAWKTTAGGLIYGTKKIPATINIIWGKLKGKAKPADPPIAQALRFPMSKYTVATAKAFLKKSKVKYISFEAGAKSKIAAAVQMAKHLLVYPEEIPQMLATEAFVSLRDALEKAVSYKFGRDAFTHDFSNKEVIIGYSKSDIRGISSWESGEYDKTAYKLDAKGEITFSGPITKVTKKVRYEKPEAIDWARLWEMEFLCRTIAEKMSKIRCICKS